MDNSGERRSADPAGQQPSPSVRPGHAITRIVSRTEEARPDPQPPAGVRTLGPRPGSCPLRFGRVRMSRLLIPGRPLSRQERGAVRFHRSIRVRPTRPAAVHLHAARRLQDHSCAAPLARARSCNTCRPANAVSDTYAHHGKADGPVICGAVRSRSNHQGQEPNVPLSRQLPHRGTAHPEAAIGGGVLSAAAQTGEDQTRLRRLCVGRTAAPGFVCLSPARLVGSRALGLRSEDRWFPARGSWCQGRGKHR